MVGLNGRVDRIASLSFWGCGRCCSRSRHFFLILPQLNRQLTAEDTKAVEQMAGNLVQKFDEKLDDNWGLISLVKVGESWISSMLEQARIGGGEP